MGSTYTTNLGLRKPAYKDSETYEAWDQVINPNWDIIDAVFGNRNYTEQNYISNSDSHTASIDKLDMQLKDTTDSAPTADQKDALVGEGTPSSANKYVTKDYVRVSRREILHPEFSGATFALDGGGANTGTLVPDSEVSGNYIYNHYKWLSAEVALNTYDICIQWKIPETWLGFDANALIVDIKTEEAASTNNKVDVILQKDGVAGTVSVTDQFSTVAATWYSERESNELIVFTQANLETTLGLVAGDVINITIRMYSKDSRYVKIGAVTIQYTG